MAQTVALFRFACDTPAFFYSPNFSAVKTEGLHSVSRIILIGGIYSGFQPQAELGAAHSRKKRSQHITVTAYLLIIALFIPAVSLFYK